MSSSSLAAWSGPVTVVIAWLTAAVSTGLLRGGCGRWLERFGFDPCNLVACLCQRLTGTAGGDFGEQRFARVEVVGGLFGFSGAGQCGGQVVGQRCGRRAARARDAGP